MLLLPPHRLEETSKNLSKLHPSIYLSLITVILSRELLAEEKSLSKLTARELDIFCCVAKGLSAKQSSEKLYLSEKTIANNISIIKKKLKFSSSLEIVYLDMLEGLASPS